MLAGFTPLVYNPVERYEVIGPLAVNFIDHYRLSTGDLNSPLERRARRAELIPPDTRRSALRAYR